ncbi:MAG: biotin synthase BioB [Planctomycetia bacterium]|nr:biotin synthase BioB [Planctomycetia bacterium]
MIDRSQKSEIRALSSLPDWQSLATRILAGHQLTSEEALAVLHSPDEQLLDLLSAAYRVRRQYFGNRVQLYFLMNAKSGLCPEDCGYCSQSKVSEAEIPRYNLLNADKLLDGARMAAQRQAKTYCIVISARGPSNREMDAITTIVPRIKSQYNLKICACLGLLTPEQAERLKACGVDRVNHNLNTSEGFYQEICSTHTYQDRVATLKAVREAGMELCSGGIVGMGEEDADVVRMAFALRDLQVESIPVNFLNPIEGTPLAGMRRLNPRYCLKVLAMFRFANPDREIRIAGGRELHLGSLQSLGLYPANSIFVGDYLTTKGQAPEADYKMIEELGFEVAHNEEPGCRLSVAESQTA